MAEQIAVGAVEASPPRVIAVTSGKGGVGKSNVTANLALAFARRGERVCILDADLGLANVDVLFGLSPHRSVLHVLRGECRLSDVIIDGPGGVRIVPAASGFAELTALGAEARIALLAEVDALDGAFDVLLVDTGAGISDNVLYFASAAAEALVVITPEPTAITDAYALIKVLATRHGRRDFLVLVNMAEHETAARAAFTRLARVAARFLRVRVEYAGYVPFDDAVSQAVCQQRPLLLTAPGSPAARAIGSLAQRLVARPAAAATGGMQFFFQRLIGEGR